MLPWMLSFYDGLWFAQTNSRCWQKNPLLQVRQDHEYVPVPDPGQELDLGLAPGLHGDYGTTARLVLTEFQVGTPPGAAGT